MEAQGFAMVGSNAKFTHVMGDKKDWIGKPVLALELNDSTKSALLLQGTNMGMFDYEDLKTFFHCKRVGDVLMPKGLDAIQEMLYFGTVMQRNGGYNRMCMHLVIGSSLHRGEFCDSVLWQKGQDPEAVAIIKDLQEKARKERMSNRNNHNG